MIARLKKVFLLTTASLPRDITLTIIGALITHLYYLQAEHNAIAEAKERARIEELVFRGIESVGTIKYTRDPSGKVIGVSIELKGSAVTNSAATGTLINKGTISAD